MRLLVLAGLMLAIIAPAQAAVKTRTVEYTQESTVMEGYLAYDDGLTGKRPGVLIVHEWMGITPYEKMRAEQLAGMGYVAFVADIYGKGVRPATRDEAARVAGIYRSNRPLLRSRAQAGLTTLTNFSGTDPSRIAAIGYCFGGTTVLELARSGAKVWGS